MSPSKKTSKKHPRYVFVVGGVMSGVGKGVTTASIGMLLQAKGYSVSLIKADPYLNVDAGTMNPTEHGEVFVLESGLETDQDMGNYERFLDRSLPAENYMTNGMVFKHVIDKERALGYGGKCVEPVPHITEEILRRIEVSRQKTNADIVIMEIGGTVGEYQNAIFIEAVRLLKQRLHNDVMTVLVSYLPVPNAIGEMKTKPTQNAARQLNAYGVMPDLIVARSSAPVDAKRREKIAFSTGIEPHNVISAPDIGTIYEAPLAFERGALAERVLAHFGLKPKKNDLARWKQTVRRLKNGKRTIKIAIVGKYFDTGDFTLGDAYLSVIEALKFSAAKLGIRADISWLSARDFEKSGAVRKLSGFDGILVPGGFGGSGVEGKVNVIRYAREQGIPYFGICYGMQFMVVEYARNVLGMRGAHTTEVDPKTPHPVIDIMPVQKALLAQNDYGGSMRLGVYKASLKSRTIARNVYGASSVDERHRHRYEVNPEYVKELESGDLIFSGTSPDGRLMEIAELPRSVHPFFLGVQFHPEFLARPLAPHPLFTEFLKAAKKRNDAGKA